MIEAVFTRTQNGFQSVEISGHADYAAAGEDIVCASVTSALQLVCNGITEVLNQQAKVIVAENKVGLSLPTDCDKAARSFLEALQLHLSVLDEDYPKTIHLTILEV